MAVYQYDTVIRYSEVDSNGYLTPVALLDLFQNCTLFHSESIGHGVEYLKEKHCAWVLSSWQICMESLPKFGEKVSVKTWSYGIKYTLGFRNFALINEEGQMICYANSIWAYIDTETLSPVKCPEEEVLKYGYDEPLEMKKAPRKIAVPEHLDEKDEFEVKYYFIDTNNHMNNGKYVLAAMEYLPSDFKVSEIRAEYKKSAVIHDIIYPYTNCEDNVFTVVMKDKEGNIYAIVQFLKE